MILLKKIIYIGSALMLAATMPHTGAQDFTPEQIKQGFDTYARHCSPCHGSRMKNPEGAFDLMTFPKDQQGRFTNSVGKGKNSMPPWDGLLKPEEIDALWAYVIAGEKP